MPADVRCDKCGSSDLKRYPLDFAGTRLSAPSYPLGMSGMAGRPNVADPILVCARCGNNQDVRR